MQQRKILAISEACSCVAPWSVMDSNKLIEIAEDVADDCIESIVGMYYQFHADTLLKFAKRIEPQWQPIETAPKDGTRIMLWEAYSDVPFVGWWINGRWTVSHEHVDAAGGWEGALLLIVLINNS